ncbi:MAG TPA: M13 family metallopeptidase [Chitinophagaceae bacterium]|jgi:putative endopeptidase
MRIKPALLVLVAFSALGACHQSPETAAKPDFLYSDLDTTIRPNDDFFEYANGGWLKKNPIPSDESSWSIANLVIEENNNRLRTINEKAAQSNAAQGTTEQKVGDFWATATDSAAIEKQGVTALEPWFQQIDAVKDFSSLINTMISMEKIGVGNVLAWYIGQDDKNSDVMAVKFWQGGIGLPEREFYFKQDTTSQKIRTAYTAYISTVLTMSGMDSNTAAKSADGILAAETKLATVHRSREALRDPVKNYNKMSAGAFYQLAPSLHLAGYFQAIGVQKVDSVIVGQPEYYASLEKFFATTPLDVLKARMRFELIKEFSGALPDAYGIAAFKFSQLFSGAKERRPRWKRVIRSEEAVMGELLGQLFAKEYFNENAKKRYEDMVEAIRTSYKERIQKLDWMSDSTKQKALKKLAAIKKKVGYPDKWKDFSSLDIKRDSYVKNLIRANQFWLQYSLNKLGKPVNRDEWEMYPQTYNAYYNPSNNEIVLPAGQLTVPGYRDEELDDALAYGYSAASTIGHEITHGFDDEGRQFDDKGNLVNWWTKDDEKKFKERSDMIAKQFDEFVVIDTFRINGKVTMGENIADLGGILLGWDAFVKTDQYKKGEKIAGLTPAQRFFLGYSLGWLSHTRNEQLRSQVLTDPHAPAKYRVNGPFVNVPAFYSTFDIKPGDKMYRADSLRVNIW